MKTQVVRSTRRKKTVEARVINGILRVSIPASMTSAEEEHWVAVMRGRIERSHRSAQIDLTARAAALSTSLGLPEPREIVFSKRQRLRWGSCTPEDGRIRISDRLGGVPDYVLDYVIVHELAHLETGDHSPAFWELVNRYEFAERARGYLEAKAGESAA